MLDIACTFIKLYCIVDYRLLEETYRKVDASSRDAFQNQSYNNRTVCLDISYGLPVLFDSDFYISPKNLFLSLE